MFTIILDIKRLFNSLCTVQNAFDILNTNVLACKSTALLFKKCSITKKTDIEFNFMV